jgi:phosphoribosylformimino-5-aminoimidazole carboxamide ribotide isomerase
LISGDSCIVASADLSALQHHDKVIAMPIEIIPSIDLRGGRVVRLQQGDYARQLNYNVDPAATAGSFRDAGAKWMHIVDLDGAKEGSPAQTKLIADVIRHSRLQVEVGGGIRSNADVQRLLDAGAARVVVGTKALEDWAWFASLVSDERFAHKLVLALDAKDGVVATRGWTASSGKRAVDVARDISSWPVAAILYTDVAKDGMLAGPNIAQTLELAQAGKVPVIASGGVGDLDHIRQLKSLPIFGVIVGRSLYEGTLDLRAAITAARG